MADIKQAAKWMQEGEKVRRPVWYGKLCCYVEGHRILYSDKEIYDMYIKDLLADDWELVE